jgi:HPt (histidine-containing phosphotransfer) domain-containing protein
MRVDGSISQLQVAAIRHETTRNPRRQEKTMAAAQRMSGFESAFKTSRDGASAFPIDLVHLARQTMGDSALEVELLALFDRQAGQIAEQLRRCELGADGFSRADSVSWIDTASRVGLAHKLKGSARAVGAHEVAAAAENYEHCASKGLLRDSDTQRLIEAVAQVRAALRDLAG